MCASRHRTRSRVTGSSSTIWPCSRAPRRSVSAGILDSRSRSTIASNPVNPRYTFESFVVGSANQFAQAACQAVAELPSRAYNPLFIYGGVGLGKTHLLHAVGHQSARLFPGLTVVYLSSERFTNELINSIRYDRTAEFRGRYRTIDLLLIDDIQFISGKERTQEEFFHTFNDLYESHKQIIVSSDCSPKDIPELEERLRSRFEWGLIADIQPPDFETRVAILKKKAELERVILPDDAAYLIGGRVKSNIRELEGSLTRMIAFCALTGREMNVDLAQEVLSELWGDEEKIITIEQVQRKVCDLFAVKPSDLKAKTRTKTIAFPRQVAMYLARKLTHASLAEIGRAFGGKDHTTVLHAVDKITTLLEEDPKLRKTIDTLIQGIQI
ncbi:MAG: chromosomal replication initiator protein DnaA [Actinobacteria bacterium]|nr:MAG: chromosomal replication initiator protein DnaA [Actinomycetota bacterium]